MKRFFSFVIFLAVIVGAVAFAPSIGQRLDMPVAEGKLQAPEIEREHAGHGHDGHAPAHGDESGGEHAPAEQHG